MPLTVTVISTTGSEEHSFGNEVTIGRDRDNDLVLAAEIVSRHHARVHVANGAVQLTDLGSGNGTTLNGQFLDPRVDVPLNEDASFEVGPYRLSVRWGAGPTGTVIAPVPAAVGVVVHEPDPSGTVIMQRFPRLLVSVDGAPFVAPLTSHVVTIGRDRTSDIVIDSPVVSRHHMRLRRTMSGYELEAVTGTNGVTVDGELFSGPRSIREGTRLEISGGVVVIVYTEVREAAPEAERAVTSSVGRDGELVIGRDASAGLVLDHPAVSRRHALVRSAAGVHTIEDLGSSNGTFVNGVRLAEGERCPVSGADEVRIGPIGLVLSGDQVREEGDSRAVSLDAVGLERRVNSKTSLLQQVSLAIRAHEFVAVVGVSGAGKSTLVGALSGLSPATSGMVWINGTPLYRNWAAFRTTIGFVPQDDILHKELTVERALRYAAALRLPSDTTAEERSRRVDRVLETLGLEDRRSAVIGQLSGGQRKRVSIGAELLTEPSLFFLDEATSGLDPGNESLLMRLLRRLADEGRTVVLITHATRNVMLCDQVVFLARGGHLAFFGPPDEALRYFGVDDFDGIYQKLDAELSPPEWAARYRESSHHRSLIEGRLVDRAAHAPADGTNGDVRRHGAGPRPVSSWAQLRILTRRYFEIIAHDRVLLAILLFIAPVVGAIDFVSTRQDVFDASAGSTQRAMTFLFLSALFPFMIGALASVREIVKEAAIYRRERSVALGVGPYLGSKVLVGLLFALYHAAALTALKALAVDIPGATLADFGALYVTIVLAVLSGVMFGLVISVITRREEQAMMLAVGVIIVQIVFSGGLVSLRDLGPAGTALGGVTSTNWALRANSTASGLTLDDCSRESLANCRLPGFASLEDESARRVTFDGINEQWGDLFDTNLFFCWVAMLAIMVALCAALYVLQRRKDAL